MKVKRKTFGNGPKLFTEFMDENDLTLEVDERSITSKHPRWYVSIERAEIKDGACLMSLSGNGWTELEAMTDLILQINGRRMVVNAYGNDRREFDVPNELYIDTLNPFGE